MKTYSRLVALVVLVSLVLLSSTLSPRTLRRASAQRRAATHAVDVLRREEAYRANNLGVALLEQFKHREGAEQFRRALALDPQLALARINLAIALFNVPDLAQAQRVAEAAAAAAPQAPQPLYILGLIAKQQNRFEDGINYFRRVLALDARDPGANVQLGQLYAQRADYARAIAAFRTALAEEPYNGTALYNLGTALMRSANSGEGQAAIRRFQALRESGAATITGTNYLEQGRYAEAVTSTGAEDGLVDRRTPDVTFRDATARSLPASNAFAPPNAAASATTTRRRAPLSSDSHVSPGSSVSNVSNDAALGSFVAGRDWAETARRLRRALAGGAALIDFDGDGDLDLFELTGDTRRLYRNDGGRFVDVTGESGALKEAATKREAAGSDDGIAGRTGFAAVAGDYDNDGKPDLLVLLEGGCALYRNEGGGRFARPLFVGGDARHPYLAVSAAFVDADHDGDLDIFIAGLADLSKAPAAFKPNQPLAFPAAFAGARNVLLRNNGDATFTDITATAKVAGEGRAAVAVIPTDYDNRRDVDLLVLNYGAAPQLFRNLRDGSFRDVAGEVGLGVRGAFTCAAAGDVNKDGFTDFFFGSADGRGLFALSDGRGRFQTIPAPAATANARAAQFLDYDEDGLLDLLALTSEGVRVLRNVGDGWQDTSARAVERTLAAQLAGSSNVAASRVQTSPRERSSSRLLLSADLDGDGDVDWVARSRGGELLAARNDGGNRNQSLSVRLAGKVSNRSAVGAKVEVRAGSLRQKLETYAATPAPAPADLVFGLGQRAQTDAVRVLWPAGIVQSEIETAGASNVAHARGTGTATGTNAPRVAAALTVTELDRKPSSCPFLYAWNGERFEFVTDFMGGGELGYWEAPGVRAVPDPDEYVRIRGDQLKARDGRYELRVTNELEEALFVDRLQLLAVAHPSGVEVYPNEGLGNPTSSVFHLYATRGAHPPRAATDEHGHDVLARVAKLDRRYPDDFQLRRVRGYAEEHTLTLDLGGEDAAPVAAPAAAPAASVASAASAAAPRGRTLLLLTGWTDYAFSSDNVAAAQQGLSLKPPALQSKDARGRWRTIVEDIGIPVGRPQTVVVDLTGKLLSASREVRIVTNMRIYWDEILVDTSGGEFPTTITRLDASSAELRWRGFSAETSADGREPFGYDYARVSSTSPWKTMPGRYTREGDVRPLLSQTDDLFVISRPGDALSLSFDATRLPPLPQGWTRTFLLYADGYSKEMDINSASPDALAPLPFHAMKSYPYAAGESYPSTAKHRAYLEEYNTRLVRQPVPELTAWPPGSER